MELHGARFEHELVIRSGKIKGHVTVITIRLFLPSDDHYKVDSPCAAPKPLTFSETKTNTHTHTSLKECRKEPDPGKHSRAVTREPHTLILPLRRPSSLEGRDDCE